MAEVTFKNHETFEIIVSYGGSEVTLKEKGVSGDSATRSIDNVAVRITAATGHQLTQGDPGRNYGSRALIIGTTKRFFAGSDYHIVIPANTFGVSVAETPTSVTVSENQ